MSISNAASISRTDMVTISPSASVVEAARSMQERHVGMLVINEKGKLGGVITDRDITLLIADGKDCSTTKVKDVMTRWPVTADEKDGLYDILKIMSKNGIRRLPLTKKGTEVVGIITLDDILKSLSTEMAQIGSTLHWEVQSEKGLKKLSMSKR